jgi:hypothetical protein
LALCNILRWRLRIWSRDQQANSQVRYSSGLHTVSSSISFFTRLRFSASSSRRLCLSSTCSSSCRWSSAFLLDSISCRLFVVLLSSFWLKLPNSPPNNLRDLSFSLILLLFLGASPGRADCFSAVLSLESRRGPSSLAESRAGDGSGSEEILPGLVRRRLLSCSETSDWRRFRSFVGGECWGSASMVGSMASVAAGAGLSVG